MLAALLLQYSQALPWVILLLVGLSALVFLLYPVQVRQVPRAFAWAPVFLRILALMAIGLSILRPVVTRPRVAAERSPLLLCFDNSASMGMVDSNRPPAEWVGIAAALGKLPFEPRDTELDAIQSDCDQLSQQADDVLRARAEMDYARLAGRGIDTAQTRLDQSIESLQTIARTAANASANLHDPALDRALAYLSRIPSGVDRDTWLDRIHDRARNAATDAEQARFARDADLYRTDSRIRPACQPLQQMSRLRLCEAAVLDPVTGLLDKLQITAPVIGFGISDRISRCDLHTPDAEPLHANGSSSNLTGQLRALLESRKENPPRALLLFSDGRLTSADTDSATLAALQSVPIFTIGAATRAGLKDLSITSAIAPSTARAGDHFSFTADLQAFGLRGTSSNVTATGGGPTESRTINFPDERPITVTFDRYFAQAGLQELDLSLAPLPGEITEQNNRIQRWVTVSPASGKPPTATQPATHPFTEDELADLTGDEAFLRRLSDSSGGQYFRLDQLNQLPHRLAELHDDANHPIEIPLWDSPFLYALVMGCLTAEWGIRKRYGMI